MLKFETTQLVKTPGSLVLLDGTVFPLEIVSRSELETTGLIAGGEVVFNTVLTGYQEVVTDPSYAGQMIAFTNPHVGNYGCNDQDMESDRVWANAVIVRDYSEVYSSFRAQYSLFDLIERSASTLVTSLDTRALTRHLRSHGALPGVIGIGAPSDLVSLVSLEMSNDNKDLASVVTRGDVLERPNDAPRVVAIDYGIKNSIINQLAKRFDLLVVPANTPGEEILAMSPSGVFLSNGPGDPGAISYSDAQLQTMIGKVPIFGICLGHQLLARAVGAKTYKLTFGHHGGNHPVRRNSNGVVEITSQNHNYAVSEESLTAARSDAVVTHLNLNDNVVEGFSIESERVFSVQYHPEAAPGPHDSLYLFDLFSQSISAI